MSNKNIEFKDSGIPWIGQIPKHWEVKKAKFIFKNKKEIIGYRAEFTDRLALTLNGVIKRSKDDNEGLQPEKFETYQILRKNNLVFKLIDLKNISTSRVGISNFDLGIVSPAYIILQRKENNKFFYYFYMSMYYRCIFNSLGDDGVRSSLNSTDLLNLKIPYPPLNEQKEIAEFLDKKCEIIDKRLSNLERKIKSLKEYKKSLISECVTKGLNPKNMEFKDSGIPWIGQIPKHWKISKIKYCFYIISGSGFEIKSQGLESGDYPVVKASDISKAGHYLYTSSNYINSKEQKNLGFKIIPKGSILMAKIGEAMKKNNRSIAMVDCCLDNNCQGLVPKDIKSDFAFYLFNCINSQWFDNSGTIPCINNVKLLNFKIPYPSIDEQKEIAEFLDKKCEKIDRLNENYTKQITALKEYKKSLIYECVTGKNI
ncbi:restriction endonuclease subunit S [Campylobacter lanienae]|uniref:restriction endonuclease subunit S n=1 Tax=Campylobacter lanienae TaxID=75658 RepID=UPI002A918EF9|nr:restriction endonuclease subunit S [Campylobacter lanienae]MDY6134621.1 restriction endonuclease subunit S [Campylobacter lanienae]